MFGKTKNYILNTANITDSDFEKVGSQATEAATLANTGVIVPNSIVLTTEAFEDFITAADLAEKITKAMHEVDPAEPATANKAADKIKALIEQASFPSLILNPMIQAYKSLSGFSDKYVTVQASWVLPPNLIPQDQIDCLRMDVKGEPALLYAIKQCWACLFSAEALLNRVNNHYQGSLTIAVLIQKVVQSEISGRAFTRDPITNDAVITIEAILGLDSTPNAKEIMPDMYRVDPDDMRIREKNIMAQEFMFLRKGRAKAEEDSTMKVGISPEWRRRQKLADHLIIELAHLVHKLSEHYGYPVEISWAFETGQLIILDAHELKPVMKQELDMQTEIDRALHEETPIEILPVMPVSPIMPPGSKFAMKQIERAVDIKSLAAEVEDMLNNPEVDAAVSHEIEMEAEPIPEVDTPLMIDQKVQEHMDGEAKEFKSDLGLMTGVYLDISDMSTDKLANASSFDGVYLDGTATVMRHSQRAEDIGSDKQKLSSLIESYALEISTAAKVIEPRPIYYSFSDVSSGDLNGSERFLAKPEALIAEILAVKRARSTYNAKNIKLILPRLRTETELSDIKKILSSQNIRRSSILQLFAEISVPSFMYELLDIGNHELDGMIINFPKLASAFTGRSEVTERDHIPVFNAIKFMLDQNSAKKFHSLMRLAPKRELIEDAMSLKLGGFIFSEVPERSALELIKALESNQLQPVAVRRGRKPKSL